MNIQALKYHKGIRYAEKYGIVDYKIKNGKLIYYANYPEYLNEKKYTIKIVVNLKTMEEKRKRLKRWNKKGNANMYK